MAWLGPGLLALAGLLGIGAAIGSVLATQCMGSNGPGFLGQIVKLMRSNCRSQAVRVCEAITWRDDVARLTLYALGLELPELAAPDDAAGYRQGAAGMAFATLASDALGSKAKQAADRYRAPTVAATAVALCGAGIAFVAAFASMLMRPPLLGPSLSQAGWAVGGLCLISVMVAFFRWRRATRTCELVVSTVLPHLVPVERMTEDARKGAAAARAALKSTGARW
jgi:hypothetical protein